MKQAIIAALIGGIVMLAAPAAFAQEEKDLGGGYIGIAGGILYDDKPPNSRGDDKAGTYRLYGGYRAEGGGALELSLNGIADLKVTCTSVFYIPGAPDPFNPLSPPLLIPSVSFREQTVERMSASLVGLYHFQFTENFSVFPKIGLAYAKVDGGNDFCVNYSDDDGTSFVYGGGAEFRFSENVAFRADIDKGTGGLDDEKFAWTAGFSFYF